MVGQAAHQEKFIFTPENLEKAKNIIAKYPTGRQASAILPLFDLAQRQCGGWLPQPAIEFVAHMINVSPMQAQEVATFYTMFHLKPVGKYHIQLCRTTPCYLKGSEEIKKSCHQHLGVGLNEVTPDGLFSISEVECLGACIQAPVVQINDEFHENLTPKSMKELIDSLMAGTSPDHKIVGPSHRKKKEHGDVK